MTTALGILPDEDVLLRELCDLKLTHPDMGFKRLLETLHDKQPGWRFNQRKVRTMLKNNGLSLSCSPKVSEDLHLRSLTEFRAHQGQDQGASHLVDSGSSNLSDLSASSSSSEREEEKLEDIDDLMGSTDSEHMPLQFQFTEEPDEEETRLNLHEYVELGPKQHRAHEPSIIDGDEWILLS